MVYRGVLLDFYGTVVEEDAPVIDSIVSRIACDRPDWSEADLGRRWWQSLSSLFVLSHGDAFRPQRDLEIASLAAVLAEAGSTLDPVELAADQFAYWRAPALRSGAAEFFAACPVPICIVSNIDRDDLDAALRHTGLSSCQAVTSEDARSYKPRPELFEAGLGRLGLRRDQALHIGDSLTSDIAGANALGIDAVWVSDGGRHRPPDLRIVSQCSDLTDVLPLLAPG